MAVHNGSTCRSSRSTPGNERSAWVRLQGGAIVDRGIAENAELLARVTHRGRFSADVPDHLAIEMIANYGMAVGATPERSRDVLVRRLAKHPDRCDCYHLESPCAGQLYSRWCAECGATVLRCDQHGGIRGATHAAELHRAEAHSGSDARDPAPENPGRVPAGGPALPLGELQAPLAARGLGKQGR
jgi:hypothetical protein